MNRPRAADDFATIRARMEELRRETEGTKLSEKEAQRDQPMPRGGAIRWPQRSARGQAGSDSLVRYVARLGGGLRGVSDPGQSATASAVAAGLSGGREAGAEGLAPQPCGSPPPLSGGREAGAEGLAPQPCGSPPPLSGGRRRRAIQPFS